MAAPPDPAFTVRIASRGKLPDDAVAVWGLTRPDVFYDPGRAQDFAELARGTLNEPFVWERDLADDRMLVVRIESADGDPIAYSWKGLEAVAIAHYAFEGQVQPVRATLDGAGLPVFSPDVPRPTAAEDMNDRFTFGPWVDGWEWVGARTQFRGDWTPAAGSDVALALLDGGGGVEACSQDDLDEASAAQADEVAEASFWTFFEQPDDATTPLQAWVGYQDWWLCTDDATYVNPAPVPYLLDVWLSTDWMTTPDAALYEGRATMRSLPR